MSEPAFAIAANSTENSTRPKGFQKGNVYAFRPGQSGNPRGRPRRQPLSEALETLLETRLPDTAEGKKIRRRYHLVKAATWADAIAASMVRRALTSTAAADSVRDSVEGRPVARMEYSGLDGTPIEIRVVYEETPKAND